MSDDRNFRYGYYEKVGFRGVEEKKKLDILLKEKPNDLLSRLSQFTLRFTMPGLYRRRVWKFLLDISHPKCEEDNFVNREQIALCEDLKRCLMIMLFCDHSTPTNKLLVMMFLLEQGDLDEEFDKQLMKSEVMDLLVIADVFSKEFLSDKSAENSLHDAYLLYKHLILAMRSNIRSLVDVCERFVNSLAIEDKVLHAHFIKYNIMETNEKKCDLERVKNLPFRPFLTWFIRLYAGIVHDQVLIRIFDRVVGAIIHGARPFIILMSIAKIIISIMREELLASNSREQITERLLSPLTLEQSEEVVSKALS